ncbi:hypothetical protein G9A89_020090 [Geosiphon pyriformis]|nr:hypothetical protein G9A89_020090 [Geosiphon pyriformis]
MSSQPSGPITFQLEKFSRWPTPYHNDVFQTGENWHPVIGPNIILKLENMVPPGVPLGGRGEPVIIIMKDICILEKLNVSYRYAATTQARMGLKYPIIGIKYNEKDAESFGGATCQRNVKIQLRIPNMDDFEKCVAILGRYINRVNEETSTTSNTQLEIPTQVLKPLQENDHVQNNQSLPPTNSMNSLIHTQRHFSNPEITKRQSKSQEKSDCYGGATKDPPSLNSCFRSPIKCAPSYGTFDSSSQSKNNFELAQDNKMRNSNENSLNESTNNKIFPSSRYGVSHETQTLAPVAQQLKVNGSQGSNLCSKNQIQMNPLQSERLQQFQSSQSYSTPFPTIPNQTGQNQTISLPSKFSQQGYQPLEHYPEKCFSSETLHSFNNQNPLFHPQAKNSHYKESSSAFSNSPSNGNEKRTGQPSTNSIPTSYNMPGSAQTKSSFPNVTPESHEDVNSSKTKAIEIISLSSSPLIDSVQIKQETKEKSTPDLIDLTLEESIEENSSVNHCFSLRKRQEYSQTLPKNEFQQTQYALNKNNFQYHTNKKLKFSSNTRQNTSLSPQNTHNKPQPSETRIMDGHLPEETLSKNSHVQAVLKEFDEEPIFQTLSNPSQVFAATASRKKEPSNIPITEIPENNPKLPIDDEELEKWVADVLKDPEFPEFVSRVEKLWKARFLVDDMLWDYTQKQS